MPKRPLRLLSCMALAAALAAPAVAAAQTTLAPGAVLVVDRQGTPIGVLMPAPTQPDPMLVQMMAMQQAMMQQMQQGFGQAVADMQPAVDATPANASGMTISTFSSSSDGCSRTMVWRQGNGEPAPRLVVDRVADRCAASAMQAPSARQQPAGSPDRDVPRLQTIVDRHVPVGRSYTPF